MTGQPSDVRAALLIVLALMTASPSLAQTTPRPKAPPPAAEPVAPPASPVAPMTPLDAAQAPGQCVRRCDRTYYFCLSGEFAEGCPDAWRACRVRCRSSSGSGPSSGVGALPAPRDAF